MRRGCVCVFDRCLSTVLPRFSEHRQVDFGDVPVEAKYCAEVRLDDITSEIGDYDHLGVWLVKAISIVHVDVLIVQRVRRG